MLLPSPPYITVSTHSRPKAAGCPKQQKQVSNQRFNTQPPEGGWALSNKGAKVGICFNTQPPEGGWPDNPTVPNKPKVSTHSRPKAAGLGFLAFCSLLVFQHTAARRRLVNRELSGDFQFIVSTHSRPKAAGPFEIFDKNYLIQFQHTAARRRLGLLPFGLIAHRWFQHTAARRRLETWLSPAIFNLLFQHTAARRRLDYFHDSRRQFAGFNTQPPEGGWVTNSTVKEASKGFQHTAARRRLDVGFYCCNYKN